MNKVLLIVGLILNAFIVINGDTPLFEIWCTSVLLLFAVMGALKTNFPKSGKDDE